MKTILICIYLAHNAISPTVESKILESGENCSDIAKKYVAKAVKGQAWAICAKQKRTQDAVR